MRQWERRRRKLHCKLYLLKHRRFCLLCYEWVRVNHIHSEVLHTLSGAAQGQGSLITLVCSEGNTGDEVSWTWAFTDTKTPKAYQALCLNCVLVPFGKKRPGCSAHQCQPTSRKTTNVQRLAPNSRQLISNSHLADRFPGWEGFQVRWERCWDWSYWMSVAPERSTKLESDSVALPGQAVDF